jgi:hypothetical protein
MREAGRNRRMEGGKKGGRKRIHTHTHILVFLQINFTFPG